MAWPDDPAPRRRRSPWGPTALIIAGLLVIGAALLIVPGILVPAPSQTPDPSAARETGSPTIPPSGTRSVTWQVIPFPGEIGDVPPRWLALVGDQLVAFGASGETLASWYATDPAGAWSSSTISPLAPPQEGAEIRLGRFARTGDRLILGGEWIQPDPLEILSAVLLLSDDSGASWRQLPQPPQLLRTNFDLLLGGDAGFLAYGTDSTANTSGWWDSADGIIWAPATVSGLSSFGPPPWDGAVGPSGTVTVGYRSVGTASVPAAWLSADGHDWELTLEGEAAFGGIQSVAGSPLGYAACGSSYADRSGDPAAGIATLWRSADGRSWTTMGLSEEAGTGAGCLAMSAEGTLVSVYGPFSETGPPAVHYAFISNGSDQMSTFEMPGISSVVARGSQFVGLLHCREIDPCVGTYVLVGTPTEDAQAPGPSLPVP